MRGTAGKSERGMMVRIVAAFLAAASAAFVQQPSFEPFQRELAAGGTLVNAAADYDRDGDVDLFVGFNGAANRFLLNERGRLQDVGVAAGIGDARTTRAAAWGDYDSDGDPDLLVGFAPGLGSVLVLYRNELGRFIDVTIPAGIGIDAGAVRQLAWVDVDADGDLDLFVGFRDRADVLFRNEKGRFADVAPDVGLADVRRTVGAVWFDYDEDGDLDAYVANMDGDGNGLYQNTSGRFSDAARSAGLEWGGRPAGLAANGTVRPCAADVDNDGRLDLIAANYGPIGVLLNRGQGRFEDVSKAWGVALDARYDTCTLSDFDHDGRIDLYVNGTVTGGVSYRDHLFRNTGARFDDVTPAALRDLHADHGAQWGDVDGDGDEDLSLTGVRSDPVPLLLRNQLPARDASRSLAVRVLDSRGRATRAGAEVRLYRAGTRQLLATRLVDSGSGYNAQNDMGVHVGLSQLVPVDVEVTFPARGRRTISRLRDVDPRRQRRLTVRVE